MHAILEYIVTNNINIVVIIMTFLGPVIAARIETRRTHRKRERGRELAYAAVQQDADNGILFSKIVQIPGVEKEDIDHLERCCKIYGCATDQSYDRRYFLVRP